MKQILYFIIFAAAMSTSCSIYRNYQRPAEEELPVENLYRFTDSIAAADTASLGDLPWQELFTDPRLQELINHGLENNTDMQVALLRLDQTQARLTAAKLSFLPSVEFSPGLSVAKEGSSAAIKSYELPLAASWEIDIFGSLRNAKQEAKAAMLSQTAYKQAVRSQLIASIASGYFSLMALDEQVDISLETLDTWREQVRTMEALLKVGEETENAVTQARASLYELEASHNDLQRQQREAENALCTLLGMTPQAIARNTLADQQMPKETNTGVALRLLSKRPDVIQAEMTLAQAYYATNVARAAFYPRLTLSGSAGWTDEIGNAVANPGRWILQALASLAQPIFKRGELISDLRVAKDEEQIALLNYKQALLDAGREVNDALYASQSALRSLESHRRQCAELSRSVTTAEALYRTGNATYLELITARQSLLSARLNLVDDRLAALQAVVNLYQALGGGS